VGLAYRGARSTWLATAQPTWAFWPEAKSSGALSPIGTGGLPAKSDRPVVVGAAVEEQALAMGALWGLGGDGRLTKEARGGEVLGRWVCAGELLEEQPRVPARGLREFKASVWSSGRCRGVQRWTGAAVHGGSMTASTVAQWQ
jgi:hypothetical protein